MARSKSLKVNDDTVKCNRMLIKNYDKLSDIELFYNHDDKLNKTSIKLLNLKNKNDSLDLDQTKIQLKNELIDSLNKRQNKIDFKLKNENLDKLKLELENNLKIDQSILNNNCEIKQIKFDTNQKLRTNQNLFINTTTNSLDDNWFLNSIDNNLTNYENIEQLSNEQSNEQLNKQSNEQSNEQQSTDNYLSGQLNELVTKNYWLFTSVNWKRRYCILEDNKLIIKDNQESKEFIKTITLDNYECFGPIKLAKLNKKAENVFGLNYSTENNPTSLLDFRYKFSADTSTEMFKWLEGLKRSILGGRNKKNGNSTRKKGKDVNDVNLESIEETKILNIAHKVNGPKNRRLPKRSRNRDLNSGQNSLENSYDSTDLISNKSENVKSTTESPIQQTVNQFKPNLNELNLNRLKTNKLNKISTSKENELNLDQQNEEINSRNELIENRFKSNKVRASSMSILDDTDCVDKSNLINRLNKRDQTYKIMNNRSTEYLEKTEKENYKSSQKHAQLLEQIKINKEQNKSKSMMSLTKSNDYLNRIDQKFINNKKNLNNSKLNLEDCSSINDSSTNNQFNQQLTKENKLFKNQQQSISNKTTIISRNNSSGSNRSFNSSTNSDHTNESTGDNQSIEFNLNNNRSNDTSSKLKKKINSKKLLNNQFYLNDDETQKTNQIDNNKNVTHNFNNNLNRIKLSNQSNRNRASLNLTNNNVDELKLKFIERGLSGSVDNLLTTNEE